MAESASKILKCEKKAISNPIQTGSWTFDVKHQSGVQFCLAFRSNGQYTNSNIFIEKLVSTAYKLKKIDLTVTSKGGVGPKIVELSKTDFRFDVEKEKLGSIPWQQQPFQVVCVAEVERAGPNGTLLSDLTEEFLLDPDNPAFADITLSSIDAWPWYRPLLEIDSVDWATYLITFLGRKAKVWERKVREQGAQARAKAANISKWVILVVIWVFLLLVFP